MGTTTPPTTWQDRVADKRARLAATIPSEWKIPPPTTDNVLDIPRTCGILSKTELAITESSATDLVARLARGELKAVDVTLAFCKRAAVAHQLVNCAHEFLPTFALSQAQALDTYYATHGAPIGPLHGLPISLKDQCRIKGHETSMGYVGWLGKYEEEDSVIVALLRKAGAVVYVKTAVPQTLMVCETVNNIIGRTVNPRNKHWSCGGSSGGEGANLALRGGVIGVGTDIGGSIRIPAAFNSLFGLRPSHGRLPYANMANSMAGQETVHSVVGPLAHTAADLTLFTQALLAQEPWRHDAKVIPLPWRADEAAAVTQRPLTIGYYADDGIVLPHPPVRGAVATVVERLRAAGHTLVPFAPYRHDEGWRLINRVYVADGSADVHAAIDGSGEPCIPNIADLLDPSQAKAVDLNAVWALQERKWGYQNAYLAHIRDVEAQLGGKRLDAILAPPAPTAAVRHDRFRYYGYASVVNLLDWTSCVVPVGFAGKGGKEKEGREAFEGREPRSEVEREVEREVWAEWEPAAYEGAPTAVQVIAPGRLQEERILGIAAEVGRVVGR